MRHTQVPDNDLQNQSESNSDDGNGNDNDDFERDQAIDLRKTKEKEAFILNQ